MIIINLGNYKLNTFKTHLTPTKKCKRVNVMIKNDIPYYKKWKIYKKRNKNLTRLHPWVTNSIIKFYSEKKSDHATYLWPREEEEEEEADDKKKVNFKAVMEMV